MEANRVLLRVGEWSTSVDSTSPYYNTIFSAMDETPEEMTFGESWDWMPEQWSKWEVLQERFERYGDDLPKYEAPVIHYRDIEMLQRCFLDLPERWPLFVVFDLESMYDVLVRSCLLGSGSYIPIHEDTEYLELREPIDVSRLTEPSLIERARQSRQKDHEQIGSFLDLWKRMADYLGRLNYEDEEGLTFAMPPIDQETAQLMLGLWQNARIQDRVFNHRHLPWTRLEEFYKNVPPRQHYNQDEDIEYATMQLFNGTFDPDYFDPSSRYTLTISIFTEQFFRTDQMTLFPELYLKTLDQCERGLLLWDKEGRPPKLIDPTPGIERWPELVNHRIASEARRVLGLEEDRDATDEELDRMSLAFLYVIGTDYGAEVLATIEDYVDNRKLSCTYNLLPIRRETWLRTYGRSLESLRRVFHNTEGLPASMSDFSSLGDLSDYLKEKLGK